MRQILLITTLVFSLLACSKDSVEPRKEFKEGEFYVKIENTSTKGSDMAIDLYYSPTQKEVDRIYLLQGHKEKKVWEKTMIAEKGKGPIAVRVTRPEGDDGEIVYTYIHWTRTKLVTERCNECAVVIPYDPNN